MLLLEVVSLCLTLSVLFLPPGTLRPDLIESASELASNKADAIKTHHNDTDLVRDLRRQVRIGSMRVLTQSPVHCFSIIYLMLSFSSLDIGFEMCSRFCYVVIA